MDLGHGVTDSESCGDGFPTRARRKSYFIQPKLEAALEVVLAELGPLTVTRAWMAILEHFASDYPGLHRRNVELARDRLLEVTGAIERMPGGKAGRGALYRTRKAMPRRCEEPTVHDARSTMQTPSIVERIVETTSCKTPNHIVEASPRGSQVQEAPSRRPNGSTMCPPKLPSGPSGYNGPDHPEGPSRSHDRRTAKPKAKLWGEDDGATARRAVLEYRERVAPWKKNKVEEQLEELFRYPLDSVRVFLNNLRLKASKAEAKKANPIRNPAAFFWSRMQTPQDFSRVEDGSCASFEEVDALVEGLASQGSRVRKVPAGPSDSRPMKLLGGPTPEKRLAEAAKAVYEGLPERDREDLDRRAEELARDAFGPGPNQDGICRVRVLAARRKLIEREHTRELRARFMSPEQRVREQGINDQLQRRMS